MSDDEERPTLGELQDAAKQSAGGVVCPECGWPCLPVVYTQRLPTGQTNRVRECRRCRTRILCRERVIAVTKRRDT